MSYWKQGLAIEYANLDASELKISKAPKCKLYHISFDAKLPSMIVPRLPYGSELATETDIWSSEPNIPRISLGSTVEGCVRGVYANISDMMVSNGMSGITFNVYEAIVGQARLVSPDTLASRAVHDAAVTGEWWALDPIRMKYCGKVVVTADVNKEWLQYTPFGMKPKEHSPKVINVKSV